MEREQETEKTGETTERRRVAALASAGVVSSALFALLTAHVRGRHSTPLDRWTRRRARRRRTRAGHHVAMVTGAAGDTLFYVPLATAASWLMRRRGYQGANAVLGAAITVAAGRHVFRWFVPRLRPPTHLRQANFFASYPSGHATGAAALGLTAAHVLAREGVVREGPALAAALLASVVVGLARVANDEHWLTDVVGGSLAGIVVASGATVAHELRRTGGPRRKPR